MRSTENNERFGAESKEQEMSGNEGVRMRRPWVVDLASQGWTDEQVNEAQLIRDVYDAVDRVRFFQPPELDDMDLDADEAERVLSHTHGSWARERVDDLKYDVILSRGRTDEWYDGFGQMLAISAAGMAPVLSNRTAEALRLMMVDPAVASGRLDGAVASYAPRCARQMGPLTPGPWVDPLEPGVQFEGTWDEFIGSCQENAVRLSGPTSDRMLGTRRTAGWWVENRDLVAGLRRLEPVSLATPREPVVSGLDVLARHMWRRVDGRGERDFHLVGAEMAQADIAAGMGVLTEREMEVSLSAAELDGNHLEAWAGYQLVVGVATTSTEMLGRAPTCWWERPGSVVDPTVVTADVERLTSPLHSVAEVRRRVFRPDTPTGSATMDARSFGAQLLVGFVEELADRLEPGDDRAAFDDVAMDLCDPWVSDSLAMGRFEDLYKSAGKPLPSIEGATATFHEALPPPPLAPADPVAQMPGRVRR